MEYELEVWFINKDQEYEYTSFDNLSMDEVIEKLKEVVPPKFYEIDCYQITVNNVTT